MYLAAPDQFRGCAEIRGVVGSDVVSIQKPAMGKPQAMSDKLVATTGETDSKARRLPPGPVGSWAKSLFRQIHASSHFPAIAPKIPQPNVLWSACGVSRISG